MSYGLIFPYFKNILLMLNTTDNEGLLNLGSKMLRAEVIYSSDLGSYSYT